MQIEVHSIGEDGRLSKRAVPLIEDGSEPTPVDLHHVMPARDFFAPVGRCKEGISALLDSLKAGEAYSQKCVCCTQAHGSGKEAYPPQSSTLFHCGARVAYAVGQGARAWVKTQTSHPNCQQFWPLQG